MSTKVLLLLTVILVLGQQSLAEPSQIESETDIDSSSEEDYGQKFYPQTCVAINNQFENHAEGKRNQMLVCLAWNLSTKKIPWVLSWRWRCSSMYRRDCGYPGISRNQCLRNKCCYDYSKQWCYRSSVRDVNRCTISPKNRKDCGSPGITAMECYSKGCCYDASKQGTVFCYYQSK